MVASLLLAARPLVGLMGALGFAVVIVVLHLPSTGFSWPGVGRNLRRSCRVLGLRWPVTGRGARVRLPALVGWLVVAPALVAVLLWWYNTAVVALLPAPSGSEVAAQAQRAQTFTAHGLPGAFSAAFLGAALPEELLFRSWVVAARPFLTLQRRGRTVLALAGLLAASTIAFGVAHRPYGELNVVTALGGGLLFALLALGSRSLYPAILAHGVLDLALVSAALSH